MIRFMGARLIIVSFHYLKGISFASLIDSDTRILTCRQFSMTATQTTTCCPRISFAYMIGCLRFAWTLVYKPTTFENSRHSWWNFWTS